MGYLIVPVAKSPHRSGRIGARSGQDWFRGLVRAKKLQEKLHPSKILVVSDFNFLNDKPEADLYVGALKELGVDESNLLVVREGLETIEQIETILRVAGERGDSLVIISTFLHYPRVRWLCWGFTAKHLVVFGLPRPKEALTDILLAGLFPILDLLGGRVWFLQKVKNRRGQGKF